MRQDYEIFFDNIAAGSKVLDVGCGRGEFLELIKRQKQCRAYGIELDSLKVSECLNKGLSVIQGDAGEELKFFPEKNNAPDIFDYVILANTLQVMQSPKEILTDASKIGSKILISSPNFGYYKNRLYLAFKGKMPVTSQLSYQWYETPNIHFSTITDLLELARKVGLKIEDAYYIDNKDKVKEFNISSPQIPNLLGRSSIFVLS